MQPQTSQTPPNTQTPQLDPQVLNLAKAIRQTESGGDFTAQGKTGEYGAFQYTEPTWNLDSQKYLGQVVPLRQATPEQQNQVAYMKIKDLKDQGFNPGQIASIWNSGKPDAYLDPNAQGVNAQGVQYNVPQYAKSVMAAYQKLKAGQQVGVDPNNPSSTASTNPVVPPTQDSRGIITPQAEEQNFRKTTDVVNTIFPGKQVGESIGTLGGLAYEKLKGLLGGQDNSQYYDTSAPSPLQTGADVAQGALMVASGLPEAGATTEAGKLAIGGAKGLPFMAGKGLVPALGRIGENGLLGAGFGLTNALANQGNVKGQTTAGGIAGTVFGVAGELASKAAEYLPYRLVRSFIPGINEDTARYAMDKGLGSPESMLKDSDASIKVLGPQLGEALKAKGESYVQPSGEELFNQVASQFPNAGLTAEDIANEVKKLVPLQKNLVDKVFSGEASLQEMHSLNSDLGSAVYKQVFDDPTVKAGKTVGNAVYQTISNVLKNSAPESAPLFDDLSKEYQLNAALRQVVRRGEKARSITLRDIVAIMAGLPFGPSASIGTLAAEKAFVSPSVNLNAAGLINNLRGPAASAIGQAIRGPLFSGVSRVANQ